MGAVIIVAAKRIGLSFDELNEFRIQDLLDILDVYAGSLKEGPQKRKATQEDVVAFWGHNPRKHVDSTK